MHSNSLFSINRNCFKFILILLLLKSINAIAFLKANDILALPYSRADIRISYGDSPRQFGDLRLPQGKGPFPVVIVIHGGCWLSNMANLNFMAPVAQALTKEGYATWNIEYRAADSKGGGWPGTFQDVGKAVDFLQTIAPKYHLDLNKVVIIGHSAGGHLALWVASRHKLPNDSLLYSGHILPIKGVISLAGPGDLRNYMPWGEKVCKNDNIANMLVGNTKALQDERFSQTSPAEMLPLGVKQIVIIGDNDLGVPAMLGEEYVAKALQKGDDATFMLAKDSAHYEVVAPGSHAWPMVLISINALLKSN